MMDQQAPLRGRVGGRWVNQRPTPEEFAEWFRKSMRIDEKLDIEDYIGGVVLIPSLDTKAKHVAGFSNDGRPIIVEQPELSFTPYAKVETRISYFWALVAAHSDEWVAKVQRVASPRVPLDFVTEEEEATSGDSTIKRHFKRRQPSAVTALEHRLPEGFSIMAVPLAQGHSLFLCCTTRVAIYDRAEWTGTPRAERQYLAPLRYGEGTKQVPLLKRGYNNNPPYADDNALMKCETGSLGRALGFAGVFVIPGSGIASAEDVLESMAQGDVPAQATEPEAPEVKPQNAALSDEFLRDRAGALYSELDEERATAFAAWAHERKIRTLKEAEGAALRGAVKKLESLLDETRNAESG